VVRLGGWGGTKRCDVVRCLRRGDGRGGSSIIHLGGWCGTKSIGCLRRADGRGGNEIVCPCPGGTKPAETRIWSDWWQQ